MSLHTICKDAIQLHRSIQDPVSDLPAIPHFSLHGHAGNQAEQHSAARLTTMKMKRTCYVSLISSFTGEYFENYRKQKEAICQDESRKNDRAADCKRSNHLNRRPKHWYMSPVVSFYCDSAFRQ